ncbi:unnamed protein product [Nyctereutes procyonoides]|uniref:ATP synthase F(0) complex subunit f, mitochondrial n=1 Tax=Nyctereutes procyonoides TaxID=34880 RepID=A0A811XZN3_NYCPR|nr:unnamed protein product [Nyctereutes procyonoides]
MGKAKKGLVDTQDSKVASSVPVKEKQLMEVKLGELPGWILMWDFTPRGTAGAFKELKHEWLLKYH